MKLLQYGDLTAKWHRYSETLLLHRNITGWQPPDLMAKAHIADEFHSLTQTDSNMCCKQCLSAFINIHATHRPFVWARLQSFHFQHHPVSLYWWNERMVCAFIWANVSAKIHPDMIHRAFEGLSFLLIHEQQTRSHSPSKNSSNQTIPSKYPGLVFGLKHMSPVIWERDRANWPTSKLTPSQLCLGQKEASLC